jgi:hypothetical protein
MSDVRMDGGATMNEQVTQMGPILVVAGLGAGWLAETFMGLRGHGLIVDMGLGVAASVVGGSAILALSGHPAGMLFMSGIGFVLAMGVILAQRLCWPRVPGARERRARLHLIELGRHSSGAEATVSTRLEAVDGRDGRGAPHRVLARIATSGIYLLRGVPLELQRAARSRAVSEGTTLGEVLLTGLSEYAAGTWTPRPDDTASTAAVPRLRATGR